MTSTGMYPPTDEHLTGFGAIVQQFARFERLMEVTMAALLGANLGPVTILVAGLGYAGKRDALLSLTKAKIMPARIRRRSLVSLTIFTNTLVYATRLRIRSGNMGVGLAPSNRSISPCGAAP